MIFFSNSEFLTPLMEPEMVNTHTLLRIVLNSNMVWPALILAALVILIPLGALTWLGIKMIFRIRERYRILSIVTFIVWIASVCALGVFLSLQLAVYADNETVEQRVSLDPVPETIWVASVKKQDGLQYDKTASVDGYRFFMNTTENRLYVSADLNIYASEDSTASITVERRASSNDNRAARDNARKVEYNWKFKGDTLWLDEYFSLPAGSRWNGSMVDIDVSLPEGTVIKLVPGTLPEGLHFRPWDTDAEAWRMKDGDLIRLDQ